jgi:hypothetical protein
MRRPLVPMTVVILTVIAGCGGGDDDAAGSSADAAPVIDPADGGNYKVTIDPAAFTSVIDNPFFPMLPGSVWKYQETTADGEVNTDVVTVLDQHKTVMGVDTVVAHDVTTDSDGNTVEDTYDWYAQDSKGNVWYFGEDSTSYDNGKASKEGSWEGGIHGALPGIVMQADPKVSSTGYRQEYLSGVAEDMAQVIAITGSVSVPAGTYDDMIKTREWSPIEPDVIEEKVYARGVGDVHEETVQPADEHEEVVLVAFTPPP